MDNNPWLFVALGMAAFFGSSIGHWIREAPRSWMSIVLVFFLSFAGLAIVSLPDWVTLVGTSILTVLMAGFVKLGYFLHGIDKKRQDKKISLTTKS